MVFIEKNKGSNIVAIIFLFKALRSSLLSNSQTLMESIQVCNYYVSHLMEIRIIHDHQTDFLLKMTKPLKTPD